ncbi:MAG: peptidoglycan editing factor PgeF [Bradymonadaceae bacterium]
MNNLITPTWPAPPHIKAYQTTRQGGVSRAPYESLNLGAHVGDDLQAVHANRRLLQDHLALPSSPRWLNQVHGTACVDATTYDGQSPADASFTTAPGLVLAIMTADCLPVLFCDDAGSFVAAAHAGWRGLAAGVLEETVRSMNKAPCELYAWLGPAIGKRAFEVGDEVRSTFLDHDPDCEPCFAPSPQGRWLADLYGLATRRLEAIGLTRISGGDHCTFEDEERFFSYRREGQTGRMGTFIWIGAVLP